MGFIIVPVKVQAQADGDRSEVIEALVDTGAMLTLIPRPMLERLGVQSRGKRQFRTIDGSPMERDVGVIDIEVQGQQPPGPVPVIFGLEDDSPVLGVTALEAMGLEVDPAGGTLRRTDMLMLATRGG